MEPSLCEGDVLLGRRATTGHEITRGDVVVVQTDVGVSVKRVVGIKDDVVYPKSAGLELNGRAVVEPYACYGGEYPQKELSASTVPSRVPKDAFFLLGDNRNMSRDSRVYGAVSLDRIIGRVIFTFPRAPSSSCVCGPINNER